MAKFSKKLKKFITRVTITTTLIGSPILITGISYQKFQENLNKQKDIQNQERFDGIGDLMARNQYGTPLTLDVKDEPYYVQFFNFNDEQKKEAVDAIKRLDDISQNLNYKIIDDDDIKVNQSIKIYYTTTEEMLNLSSNSSAIGYINYNYDNSSATISYPINIYVSNYVDNIYDENGVSLLSYVIKHEMMHSLGFCDLYYDEYLNKSIMYYQVDKNLYNNDFTEFDEQNIKQIYDYETTSLKEQYDNGNIKTYYPDINSMVYNPKLNLISQKNNDDDLTY